MRKNKKNIPNASRKDAKLRCPYCLRELEPKDIIFFSKGGITVNDMGESILTNGEKQFINGINEYLLPGLQNCDAFLDAKIFHAGEEYALDTHEVVIPKGSRYPTQITVNVNGRTKELTRRVCCNCHCFIPDNAENIDTHHIWLFGDTSCGKSSYVAALLKSLIARWPEGTGIPNGDSIIYPGFGSFSIEPDCVFYAKKIINEWQERRREATPYMFPLVLRWTGADGREVLVVFHDMKGEDVGNGDNLRQTIRSLEGSDLNLMLMLDLCQFPPYNAKNIGEICTSSLSAVLTGGSITMDVREQFKAADVAVTVCKFDHYVDEQSKEDQEQLISLRPRCKYRSPLNASFMGQLSDEVKRLFRYGFDKSVSKIKEEESRKRKMDETGNIKLIESYFGGSETDDRNPGNTLHRIEYFCTGTYYARQDSIQGESAGLAASKVALQTHRIEEPLLYFLVRWGLLEARHGSEMK